MDRYAHAFLEKKGDMPVSSRTRSLVFFALKIGQGHREMGGVQSVAK